VDAIRGLFTGLGLPFPLLESRLGASVPSFAVAFVLSLIVLPRRDQSVASRRAQSSFP
jgi:hypothetical protein